jgi:aminopeptidase N
VDSYAGTLRQINEYLVTATERADYQTWIRANFRPMLARIGWTPAPGESDDTRQLRASLISILGMTGEDPETISHALKLARQYLKDPNSVDASMADDVLKVAARNGDAALFEEYLAAMSGMNAPEQFYAVGSAMAQFRDPKLVERVLQASVSETVRNQDASTLISSVMRVRENQAVAWAWIKAHWPEVEKKLTMASGSGIVDATNRFCEADARDDVQKFFSEHHVQSAERALKQSVERMNSCINYRQTQQSNLSAWLKEHSTTAAATGTR